MRFIGCKINLMPYIERLVAETVDAKEGVFCDLFAGTATVGAHFKKQGFQIISNDLLEVSAAFQHALIANNTDPQFAGIVETLGDVESIGLFPVQSAYNKVIAWLNYLPGKKGFIFNAYCPSGNNEYGRQYFSDVNGQKIDAIRQQIQIWREAGDITENEFYLLLLPLLEATSKIANISGTYAAYLKSWDPRTYKPLTLVPIDIIPSQLTHSVYRKAANDLIDEIQCDVLYIDPPYNTRQYITNYHLLETIARYDNPPIHGKTGLRDYKAFEKSAYCSKTSCLSALTDLVEKADAKHIVFSYSNEGILSPDEILTVLSSRGEATLNATIDYQRYKSHSHGSNKQKSVQELLFHAKIVTTPKRVGLFAEEKVAKPKLKKPQDPRNKLNDLSGSEWIYFLNSVELEGEEYNLGSLNDLTETEWALDHAPVWDTHYSTRGKESFAHHIRKQHPSPKPPQLMLRLIEFFTKKGGKVLDPFVGVGGTLLACSMTKRQGVGVDLSPNYLEIYHKASAELGLTPQTVFIGDSRELQHILKDTDPFDLILTDPPYADMLSRKQSGDKKKRTGDDSPTPFTEEPNDLGNMSRDDFYKSLHKVINEAVQYLKPKGYVVIFCKDLQPTKEYHNMIHVDVVNVLSEIKDLQFRGYKIWYDKSQKLYPFGYPYAYVSNQFHQFILVFRKEK